MTSELVAGTSQEGHESDPVFKWLVLSGVDGKGAGPKQDEATSESGETWTRALVLGCPFYQAFLSFVTTQCVK